MSRFTWSRLERGARIGVIVVLVPLLLLTPFLSLAGLAIINVSAGWAHSVGGLALAILAGLCAFVAYLLVVFGVPLFLGGLVGAAVQRALRRV